MKKEGVLPLWSRSGHLFICPSHMMENKVERAPSEEAGTLGVLRNSRVVKGQREERRVCH